ncbi:VOC family protein [Actinomadura barringtoniae]|uniref:VOC family protein n=1 Tax=Actinomadura barringtoniae TaxID=1427535 RepID=A0A939P9D9_9ACTN|nr:VOC family protein [Actinomadura barringtoniae]MBO2445743.1 VOC family protein [Actinomadura barringtoniae]
MIDHLVYAAPDLSAAVADIARRTGVDPIPGGPHVGLGTRNHLLGLGGPTYLEIVGPDPDQPAPDAPRPFGVDDLTAPALVAWAVATSDIDAAVARARAAGYEPGPAHDMSRRRPDGRVLQWRLTPLITGLVPFLIDWGDTPHPAAELPVVPLISFEAVHPEPDAVRADLAALGAELPVRQGGRELLTARLQGREGVVSL